MSLTACSAKKTEDRAVVVCLLFQFCPTKCKNCWLPLNWFHTATATAAVEKSFEGEIINDENQIGKTDLTVLKGGFSTSDHRYDFEIKSDGTGETFYTDFDEDSEEFLHEIKVEKLASEIEEAIWEQIALQSEPNALEDSEIESIREETVAEMLKKVFWEEKKGNNILDSVSFLW